MKTMTRSESPLFVYYLTLTITPMGTAVALCSIIASLLIAANQYDMIKNRVIEKYGGSWRAYGRFLLPKLFEFIDRFKPKNDA